MSKRILTILPAATAASTGPGVSLLSEDTRNIAYQATLTGTGAVTASIVVEVSNDNVGWISDSTSTLSLSGTTVASVGFVSSATWAYARARVTAITGTGAAVVVTASLGD